MSKKFKFELGGMMFQLPISKLRTIDYMGNKLPNPTIQIDQVAAASVIKQYVKTKYPQICVNATSHSYSGGCSTDVYLSDEYGNGVDETIVKDIDIFAQTFKMGSYNGMIDMYEYSDKEIKTDNGTKIDYGVKYIFVNNKPKFMTVPDIYKTIKDLMNGGYSYGVVSFERAIEIVKSFGGTQNNIDKAIDLMSKK